MADSTKRIIYPTDDGGVGVIVPDPNCHLTVEQIALKDVPAGVPFKIVDVSEISPDRVFRNAWEVIIEQPDGIGIGHDEWFAGRRNA